LPENPSVPVIVVAGLRGSVGEIVSAFYRQPSVEPKVVAVTGTNGKTSVSHLIAEAAHIAGSRSALIGTLGNGIVGELNETANTTPDVVTVQHLFSEFREQQAAIVAVEASSHGLEQGRLDGTRINVGVFTNLTRDHLDYHGTMAAYFDAKKQLVYWPGLEALVINLDDVEVASLAGSCPEQVEVVSYSINPESGADYFAREIVPGPDGLFLKAATPKGDVCIQSRLWGNFNASNLLAALSVLGNLGFTMKNAAAALQQVGPAAGRLERIALRGVDAAPADRLPTVIVDFAHTPDAMEKVLSVLRAHCKGNLWCVFGCGGDRDKGKRPEMGHIAARYADRVILTSDNPRTEPVGSIIREIRSGVRRAGHCEDVLDREQAVFKAVTEAEPGDLILLAGKGHESYQEVDGTRYVYSDREVAQQALQGKFEAQFH